MSIIDADSHVIESQETWQYLDPKFAKRRPVPVAVPADTSFLDWNTFWIIDRQVRHFGATPIEGNVMAGRKSYSPDVQQITDVKARLTAMDRMGVAKQLVHPSFTLSTLTEDPELEAALFQSYNTFMSKACAESGGRIFFNAVVPYRQPEQAVAELRRLDRMPGMASVLVRGLEWDKPIDDPSHYPVFAEAERLGLPMVVHLGLGSPSMYRMFDGMAHPVAEKKTFYPARSRRLLSTLTVQYAFYNLMESTLIDDFPKLKWVFLEGGGCTWMVGAVRTIERSGKPRVLDHFEAGRVLVGCEPDDDIPYAAGVLGEHALLVSSDMPHFDEAAHDSIAEEYEERGDLSPELLKKMFTQNAERVFDFGRVAARTVVPA
ncbi:MAG: amidohydrolase family protein [Rhodospirillales bacterium]|nr:amidohydrolase family protein [Rhodospirillales bacterium]